MSIPAFHGSASDLARSRPSGPSAGFSFPFRGGSCRGALAENASASRAVEPSSHRASTFFYESPRNLRIPRIPTYPTSSSIRYSTILQPTSLLFQNSNSPLQLCPLNSKANSQ